VGDKIGNAKKLFVFVVSRKYPWSQRKSREHTKWVITQELVRGKAGEQKKPRIFVEPAVRSRVRIEVVRNEAITRS